MSTITERLNFTLNGTKDWVRFVYRTRDPFAVTLEFRDGHTWCFGRALLAEGLTRPVGEGDVCVSSLDDSVYVTLCSPNGTASLVFDLTEVCDALSLTAKMVPHGEEVLDFDAELAKLVLDHG